MAARATRTAALLGLFLGMGFGAKQALAIPYFTGPVYGGQAYGFDNSQLDLLPQYVLVDDFGQVSVGDDEQSGASNFTLLLSLEEMGSATANSIVSTVSVQVFKQDDTTGPFLLFFTALVGDDYNDSGFDIYSDTDELVVIHAPYEGAPDLWLLGFLIDEPDEVLTDPDQGATRTFTYEVDSGAQGKFFPTLGMSAATKFEVVPEPTTLLLVAGGLVGLAHWRRRVRTR